MEEWRRVLCRKGIAVMVILLFLVNGVLFLRQQRIDLFGGWESVKTDADSRKQTYEEIKIFLEHYRNLSMGQALETVSGYLDQRMEERMQQGDAYVPLAKDSAYSLLEQQYRYILETFPERMAAIQENARQMKENMIASGDSRFAERNIEKTAADFQGISDVTLTPGYNEAVTPLAEYGQTEYLTFLFLLILILFFMEERKKGLWNLIYATPGGRIRQAARRSGLMAVSACVMTGLLWAENLLLAVWVYGSLGDLSRSVQSVPGFDNVTLRVSVGTYLLLLILGKMLLMAVLGLLIWVFTAYSRMAVLGVGGAVLFLGAEYAAWTWIPRSNPFSGFKYINLFAFLDSKTVMQSYNNLNLFGFPVGIFSVFWIVLTLLLLGLGALAVYSGRIRPTAELSIVRKFLLRVKGLFHHQKENRKRRRRLIPVCHELYKQMIVQGGIFVLAVLLFLSIRGIDVYPVQYDYSMQLYLNYIEILKGPYLPEKQAYLEQEKQNLAERMRQIEEEEGRSDTYKALQNVDEMLTELVTLSGQYADCTEKGIPVEYVSRIGYDKLYGTESKRTEMGQAILIMTAVILLAGGLFAYERQQGARLYLGVMRYGRGRVRVRKYLLTAAGTFLICLTVYGCQMYEVCSNYGLTGLSAPVQSVAVFVDLPLRLTVWQFLIVLYLVRYLAALSLGFLVLFISEHSAGILQSLIKSLMIFVLPAGMVYIGVDAFTRFSIFSPLCLMNGMRDAGGMTLGVISGFLICVGLAAAGVVVSWKRKGGTVR